MVPEVRLLRYFLAVADEVTITGKHFVQEDSPDEIGQAIRQFVQDTRGRDR